MNLGGPVRGLAIRPDGKHVATAAVVGLPPEFAAFMEYPVDCEIAVWDAATGELVDRDMTRNVVPRSLIMDPERVIWTELMPNRIGVWMGNSSIGAVDVGSWDVVLAPGGRRAYALSYQEERAVIITTEANFPARQVPFPPTSRLYPLSPDGQIGIGITESSTLRPLELTTGRWLPNFKHTMLSDRRWVVTPDALAGLQCDREVALWNLRSGQCIAEFDADPETIKAIALTPDARYVALGDDLGEITVWRLPGMTCCGAYTADAAISMLEISHTGHRVAATDLSANLHILDVVQ